MIAAASPILRLVTVVANFSLVVSSLNTLAVLISCCATNLRSPMILRWCCAGAHLLQKAILSRGFDPLASRLALRTDLYFVCDIYMQVQT